MIPASNTLLLAGALRKSGFFARLARGDNNAAGLANPGAMLARGKDAASFLHSQVTNDVEGLAPGEGNFSARVNLQGQLLHFFSLHRLPGTSEAPAEFLLILERAAVPQLIAAFEDFLFSDDVTCTDVSNDYHFSTLQGPDAERALEAAASTDASSQWEDFEAYAVRELKITDAAPCLVISRSLAGDAGFLVAAPKRLGLAAEQFENRVEQAARDVGFEVLIEPELSQVLEIMRIEAGQFRVGPDTHERKCLLPETGLEQHAVSYTKGCYLGQEVIARVRTYGALPFGLRGLVFECAQQGDWPQQAALLERLPESGAKLYSVDGKKSIGQIVSRTISPVMEYPIAFAYLDKAHRTPGTQIDIRCKEGDDGALAARVTLLPFYNAPGRDERVAFLYDRAIRVFAQGAEEDALSILEDALKLDPGFSDGYEAVGVILGRSERFHEAIDIFKRLEEIAPEAPMVNTNLSLYYMKIGDKTSAENEAAKAMQKSLAAGTGTGISSDEIDAQVQEQALSDAKRKLGMFSQILEIDPEDDVALFGTGNALSTLGEWGRAESHYAKACEVDPKNSAVYLARGKALEALDRLADAEAVYRDGMDVASRKGDLMPLKEMEHRMLLLSGANQSTGGGPAT
jgi:folate-binding protein YgfZ